MGRSEHETHRLERQAQLYGPLTRRFFVDAGIGQGMHVLDVGSGAGDVALLAAELVGPTGKVVGIDQNAQILDVARQRVQAAGWHNVTFIQGDVRTAQLERRSFDAALGRFVLFWTADPVEVLRACAARVRIGGIVAFQEHDALGLYEAVPPEKVVQDYCRLATKLMELRGLNPANGYELFANFVAAGLSKPSMTYVAPIGGGSEWVGYDVLADHARSNAPFMVEDGLTTWDELDVDTMADRVRAQVVASHGVLRCIPAVGIWARVPPLDEDTLGGEDEPN